MTKWVYSFGAGHNEGRADLQVHWDRHRTDPRRGSLTSRRDGRSFVRRDHNANLGGWQAMGICNEVQSTPRS